MCISYRGWLDAPKDVYKRQGLEIGRFAHLIHVALRQFSVGQERGDKITQRLAAHIIAETVVGVQAGLRRTPGIIQHDQGDGARRSAQKWANFQDVLPGPELAEEVI